MWLVCTRISSLCRSYVLICHSYVLVCQLYVTRMYSYVIHMFVYGFTTTLLTHCFGYSSNLEVKELTSHCKIWGDNIETVGEITVLVKFSTKGEKILGSLIEMLRGYKKMKLLVITRGPWINYMQRVRQLEEGVFKISSLTIAAYNSCGKMSRRNFNQRSHSVKSVQIRSTSWSVFSCIRTEYRKIQTRNNSVFGHFSRSEHDQG